MINIMVEHNLIYVEGAKNCLVIEGRFKSGRDFSIGEISEIDKVPNDEFDSYTLSNGQKETLRSCGHTNGDTVEKVYHIGDRLVFVSFVDECFLSYSGTETYIDAVYGIKKKEFYIPDGDEEAQLESLIERL